MTVARAGAHSKLKDRQAAIAQEVQRHGRADVTELGHLFGVSEVSIRRDLDHLHSLGLVRRVRGGAEALQRTGQAAAIDIRLLQNAEVKQRLGQAAAALILPGNVIQLDSGSTVLEVARHISPSALSSGGLTVITRSLFIASEFRHQRQTRLILLGGIYAHEFDTFVGPGVEAALRELHVHILFLGADGITAERGLTTDNVLEAGLFRLLARQADQIVVVADSTKIGVSHLQSILGLDEVDTLVTDSGAPAEFVRWLEDRGTRVTVVPRP